MRHTPPNLLELTPEMHERLERFREEHEGEPIGNVADTVIFEDEKLRIWEMKLEPGEHSDLHRHDHDYYLVIFSGDRIAAVPSRESGESPYLAKVPTGGNTVSIPKGGTEWAWNVGDETYHEILIELKQT